jgi:hypothetical protein
MYCVAITNESKQITTGIILCINEKEKLPDRPGLSRLNSFTLSLVNLLINFIIYTVNKLSISFSIIIFAFIVNEIETVTYEKEIVMKKYFAGILVLLNAFFVYAQWNDGVLIDVQEINIAKMKAARLPGTEAVMKVMEQYADDRYRFAFVSSNYLIPAEQQKYLNVGKDRFLIAVASYPSRHNLLYAQVFFDKSFFFVALAKTEHDLKGSNEMQIIKMNYEKRNAVRRNNLLDTIQRNNIIPLGIDTVVRYEK